MTIRPARPRRSQLSVPGSSEKMLAKAAASNADHVFCDLEDAVAPSAKVEARDKIAWALNNLNWGTKTRCVRINDVTTQWCHDDVITIVEKAGKSVDTIMLTKPYTAADVIFLDRLLGQLEAKLGLDYRIGIEVLIEEVGALQNVEAIATCSNRMEALIFGMGDYSCSQGLDWLAIGDQAVYPGDILHYARFRVTMAARAAGIDAIDGPYADVKNEMGYRAQARMAKSLGMVGKWAIHPSQIAPALEIFAPTIEEVDRARRMETAFLAAQDEGLGAAMFEGNMIDAATLRLVRGTLSKAELYRV
ncbi:CoA ester lyase [Bradyrhizobium sp. B097]|uniref:HpcH/HpaI aldolase/citrate lyase family protein n=1 Tax=Bradyrhizobium sp. B097 TaxID=3140244 RepID=UPI003183C60F